MEGMWREMAVAYFAAKEKDFELKFDARLGLEFNSFRNN